MVPWSPGLLLPSFSGRNASFLWPAPGSFTCCQETIGLLMQVAKHKPSCATAGFDPCCGSHCPYWTLVPPSHGHFHISSRNEVHSWPPSPQNGCEEKQAELSGL